MQSICCVTLLVLSSSYSLHYHTRGIQMLEMSCGSLCALIMGTFLMLNVQAHWNVQATNLPKIFLNYLGDSCFCVFVSLERNSCASDCFRDLKTNNVCRPQSM